MKKYFIKLRTTYLNNEGQHPVIIEFRDELTRKVIQTGIYVTKKNWDNKNKKISHYDFLSSQKNKTIELYRAKANEYILRESLDNQNKSLDDFINYVTNKQSKTIEILYKDFATDFIENKKDVFAKEHYRSLKTEISKLEKFRTNLSLKDIDYNFILSYEAYMRSTLENKTNTVQKSLKRLKAILNEAIRQDKITKNPFDNYKIISEKTSRSFLSLQELKTLEKYYNNIKTSPKLKNVLQYFLFSCYTGLRFTDVQNLTFNNIENNILKINIHKTNDFLMIPLSNKAIDLLPEQKTEKIFNVLSNQKTNDFLKVIAEANNIKQVLTFHTARHTFATISVSLGIPIEVISKILGHNKITTTQIYAKIMQNVVSNEMDKWNKF